MKAKLAEHVFQAYLSGILVHIGRSVAILNENGKAFKNKVLNEACNQLSIKQLFSNPFHSQGNTKVENVHNFLKWTTTKFIESSDLEWDEFLPFECYNCNIFLGSNGKESPFLLMFGWDPAEGCLTHLNNSNTYHGTNKGKIILEELHKLWKHHAGHLRELWPRREYANQ